MVKGAIQMSLGFIVTIVIAVVMLSLVLTWMRGMFGGVNDLTKTLEQEALNNLRNAFQQQTGNFYIYPTEYTVAPNTRLPVYAGIKNDAADGRPHEYVVGVSIEAFPKNVDPATVMGWLTWVESKKTILPNQDSTITISITVPSNAIKGTYIFRITPCSDIDITTGTVTSVPSASQCNPTSNNIWAAAKDFVLTVE